ncbi:hypothetical protein QP342_26225, partial [Klebsiella pneumoniae]
MLFDVHFTHRARRVRTSDEVNFCAVLIADARDETLVEQRAPHFEVRVLTDPAHDLFLVEVACQHVRAQVAHPLLVLARGEDVDEAQRVSDELDIRLRRVREAQHHPGGVARLAPAGART